MCNKNEKLLNFVLSISRIFVIVLVISFSLNVGLSAQSSKATDIWEPYNFLLGEWIGEGNGQPGRGEGGSSFTFDLNNNILIRKSYNNIPASEGRPAVNHEDLMVVYHTPQMPHNAIYWDNEGHTIHYEVEFSADDKTLTFLSEPNQQAPRFKLTYESLADDTLKVIFELAPPNKPDEFSLYTTGIMYKK